MKLNLSKTKELVIKGEQPCPPPEPIVTIKRVLYLKLLGVTLRDSPTNWDKHFDELMERVLIKKRAACKHGVMDARGRLLSTKEA